MSRLAEESAIDRWPGGGMEILVGGQWAAAFFSFFLGGIDASPGSAVPEKGE